MPKYDYQSTCKEGRRLVYRGGVFAGRPSFGGNSQYGFVDEQDREVIPLIYTLARDFDNGLALVKSDKYGFVDPNGDIQIPLIYDNAKPFRAGLAPVKMGRATNFGWGCIDLLNRVVIHLVHPEIFPFDEDTGLALVFEQDIIPYNDSSRIEGKYGFINQRGEMVVSLQYDYAESFSDGRALVQKNASQYGFIDAHGKEIIPTMFSRAYSYSENHAFVQSDNKWGVVDLHGNLVVPFLYDTDHMNTKTVFHNGIAIVCKDGKYGAIATNGGAVVPCIYALILAFVDGRAYAQRDGKFGFLDTQGYEIVPCIYDKIEYFNEDGWALAKKDGQWGALDRDGNIVEPFVTR